MSDDVPGLTFRLIHFSCMSRQDWHTMATIEEEEEEEEEGADDDSAAEVDDDDEDDVTSSATGSVTVATSIATVAEESTVTEAASVATVKEAAAEATARENSPVRGTGTSLYRAMPYLATQEQVNNARKGWQHEKRLVLQSG